jgi:hypothetical protein
VKYNRGHEAERENILRHDQESLQRLPPAPTGQPGSHAVGLEGGWLPEGEPD